MKSILLDTNIYISAILFGGKPRDIICLAKNEEIEIIVSEYILWEIREVLSQKFHVPDARLFTIEHDILSIARVIKVSSFGLLGSRDVDDNAILACAIDGKADAIVTGDKDLLVLRKYRGISILSPSQFIAKAGK